MPSRVPILQPAPVRHIFPVLAKGTMMLRYAIVLFVIALSAVPFGFAGIASGAAEVAKVLFYIFLGLFIVSLLVGIFRRG